MTAAAKQDEFPVDLFHLDRCLTPAERKLLTRKKQKSLHAAAPGTGPAGETCGSCRHIYRTRRYRKCLLCRGQWTHGPATDLRAADPACSKWQKPHQCPVCDGALDSGNPYNNRFWCKKCKEFREAKPDAGHGVGGGAVPQGGAVK